MYTLVKLTDTVRVSPERFGEDLHDTVNDIVQTTFEGTIRRKHGLIVAVENIKTLGSGIVIHGDGGMYQKVEFDALTFNPLLQEITDAIICEIVEFGAFCHIGPLDALIHMSQIMNDYVNIDAENERVVGKENKKVLKVGDHVRARVVAISLNELSARESKIGLTMRQPALGAYEWLKEPEEEKKDEKKKGKKQKKKAKKEEQK
jgi:DNA-directed RNA polymerase subunit E'